MSERNNDVPGHRAALDDAELEAELASFVISDADIDEIEPALQQRLAWFGITTAADIDPQQALPWIAGLDARQASALLAWRLMVEEELRQEPPAVSTLREPSLDNDNVVDLSREPPNEEPSPIDQPEQREAVSEAGVNLDTLSSGGPYAKSVSWWSSQRSDTLRRRTATVAWGLVIVVLGVIVMRSLDQADRSARTVISPKAAEDNYEGDSTVVSTPPGTTNPGPPPGDATEVPPPPPPPPPASVMSSTRLDFGGLVIGSQSRGQAVTLSNRGATDLSIAGASLGGPHSADFAIRSDTCTGATLRPGARCAVGVAFVPSTPGDRQASLAITGTDGSASSVALAGTGIAPTPTAPTPAPPPPSAPAPSALAPSAPAPPSTSALPPVSTSVPSPPPPPSTTPPPTQPPSPPARTVGPNAVNFGNQIVGTRSSAKEVSVNAAGGRPLKVSKVAITGSHSSDFMVTSDSCTGATVASGSSCVVGIVFAPTATGARNAVLTVGHDGTGGASMAILHGTGVAPSAPPPSQEQIVLASSSVRAGNPVRGVVADPKSVQSLSVSGCGLTTNQPVAINTVNGTFSVLLAQRTGQCSLTFTLRRLGGQPPFTRTFLITISP